MIECIDRQMQLGALLAFGSIVGGPRAALGRGAQGAAVDDGRAGLDTLASGQAQEHAQVFGQGLEATGPQPAPSLLIDDLPRRQIVGHPAPRARSS